MFKSLVFVLACMIALYARCPAYADMAAALTEVYTYSGVSDWVQPAPPGLHAFLGAGVFEGQRIMGDARRKIVVLPVVLLTYQEWAYWSLCGGGMWLYDSADRSFRIGAGVKVRPGYRPDNDPVLIGMESRQTSLDGYVNALLKTPVVNIGVAWYHDIGGVTKGDAITIRLLHNFEITKDFWLTPSAGLDWENEKLVYYYYGVRPEEALPDRPSYAGHGSVNYGASVSGAYRISRSWSLLGGVFATHFSNGIADSPIVTKRHTKLAYLGAGWTF